MTSTLIQAWERARIEADRLSSVRLSALFAADPERARRLSFGVGPLWADFSKQKLDADALGALLALAEAADFDAQRAALFAGAPVNASENRPALHTALRGVATDSKFTALAQTARAQARAFAERVRGNAHLGATGRPIRQILHLGVGGSDLGPRLAMEAFKRFVTPGFEVRFAANVDPADLADALEGLDPEQTLVLVVSKSFTTLETRANAAVAMDWLTRNLPPGADLSKHLAAVTANPDRAQEQGYGADAVFGFPDWVGGRYSLWSAVGLSVEIAVGSETFDALLDGGAQMDQHFQTAPLAGNLPALKGLIDAWNRGAGGGARPAGSR
ncbi:MAG: hypothetical protein ACFB2Z_07505 [Maricaulaceae bacterium]